MAATLNRGCPAAPAVTKPPTSTLRAVTVPANGATTLPKVFSSDSRRAFAPTLAAAACHGAGLTAGDRPRWVVVSLQDGFPLETTVWDERPAYG